MIAVAAILWALAGLVWAVIAWREVEHYRATPKPARRPHPNH